MSSPSASIKLPHRAETIGSLLRPTALKAAHKAWRDGAIAEAAYRRILADAIAGAVAMQEALGLCTITDGEFRRASWFSAFFEALDGFDLKPSRFAFTDQDGHGHDWDTCHACAPIRRKRGIATDEFSDLSRLTRRSIKIALPSPSAFHFFRLDFCAEPSVYPDLDRFWNDLVAVYRAEIAALAALGARYIQLDEVPLALLCDPRLREQVRGLGADPDALVRHYVAATNRILADRPAGLFVGMHLCRGNFRGRWMAEGGYAPVAEALFGTLAVDAFFLEYDSPRAGDFSPLAAMPADKAVVLGLISTKHALLEDPDDIRRRIDEAGRLIPLERLALSPQCGFASVAGGNPISEAEQEAKLRLLVAVARQVWGEA